MNTNPDWMALRVWVRRVYDRSVANQYLSMHSVTPSACMGQALMYALFTAVVKMRDAGDAWEAVETMVDAQHQVFVFANARWALQA